MEQQHRHRWLDVTTLEDRTAHFVCALCGKRKAEKLPEHLVTER